MQELNRPLKSLYFATVCACNRQNLFGEIINGKMELNNSGLFTRQCWQEIPQHFPGVALDEFVVMPNHVHGINLPLPDGFMPTPG